MIQRTSYINPLLEQLCLWDIFQDIRRCIGILSRSCRLDSSQLSLSMCDIWRSRGCIDRLIRMFVFILLHREARIGFCCLLRGLGLHMRCIRLYCRFGKWGCSRYKLRRRGIDLLDKLVRICFLLVYSLRDM